MARASIRAMALLALLALCMVGQADTLRFRDGSSVTGSWLGGTADEVRLLVNNQVQTYPKADIVDVTFGAATPAPEGLKIAVEPDVIGVVYLQDPTEKLIPLERTLGVLVRGATVYGPPQSIWRVGGTRSPVRVRQGDKLVLTVRVAYGVDPRKYELYAFESKRDSRQTPPMRAGARPVALPVTIRRISDSTYGISPTRFLMPGEYALSPRDSNESFCFGIDY
jgi:hypothetical protein